MNKILLFAAALFAFAGCEKDMPTEGPSVEVTQVVDMVIPGDFDWKTTSNVVCDFTAPHATQVSVASKEGAEPFATFVAGDGSEPFMLSVPRAARTLFVSYTTEAGVVKSSPVTVAERIQFAIPIDSRVYQAATRAATTNGLIAYPDRGVWGTLMFEDLWPAYGDYDFNDVVMNYSVHQILQEHNMVERMIVTLRVKATSGSLPYDFYVSLPGVQGHDIAKTEVTSSENAPGKVTVTSLTDGKYAGGPAILEVKGWRGNVNKPAGSIYLNTERGYELAETDLVSISFEVTFTEPVAPRYLTVDAFDFYLGRTDDQGRRLEIHMGNFKPSAAAFEDYEAIRQGNTNIGQARKPYFSNDNLVWGLNIPCDVLHGYEKGNFLEAYPRFRTWAESNGLLAQDWYLQGVDENLVHNAR